MDTTVRLMILGTAVAIGACGQAADDAPAVTRASTTTNDDVLLAISEDTGLTIIDVSVPFERLGGAPARLRQIADALNNGSGGLYVMRYSDDTLRQTYHIFAIRASGGVYVELTSFPSEEPTREESEINSAEYDEQTTTLTLHTSTGDIRLAPTDVTPVGA